MSKSLGTKSPDPAAISVTASSAAVCCTLPVPPPFTNSRSGATARTARTTAARRSASSLRAAACISRIARDRSGRPRERVPDPRDMPLVRHDPDQPEAGTPLDRTGQLREFRGLAQRGTAGADPDPAAQQTERRVQLQTDPDLLRPARAGGVDQIQLRHVVDHHGHGGGQLRVPRQLAEPGAVRRGVGEQHVLEPGAREPQRLVERERHDPREALPREDPLQERPAPDGLARHPHRLAAGPAHEVRGVGVEGLQIDDRHGRVEMSGGPVVTGPVGGTGSHGPSLPDGFTGG